MSELNVVRLTSQFERGLCAVAAAEQSNDARDALGAPLRAPGQNVSGARGLALEGDPVETRLFDPPRFALARGGAYSSLPGRSALQ